MAKIGSLRKIIQVGLVGAGVVSGAGLAYYAATPSPVKASSLQEAEKTLANRGNLLNGQIVKTYPDPVKFYSIPWDSNWDRKGYPTNVNTKRSKKVQDDVDNTERGETVTSKPKASRHIILIRHGQYDMSKKKDEERKLTDLGREQALKTGERLKSLNIKFDKLIHSDMTRATETANLVSESLPDVPKSSCSLLREGSPCRPEPQTSSRMDDWEIYQEGAQIEAAFRKYFYRADVTQEKDSYEVIVCHGNVIRYFACRALQFPPDGWLRMTIGHCGITRITIRPNGRVSMKALGDTGHLPPELLTFS